MDNNRIITRGQAVTNRRKEHRGKVGGKPWFLGIGFKPRQTTAKPERILGKAEVVSSILTGSTSILLTKQ